MRRVRVTNATRGRELGDRVMLADRSWLRLRGLIGRPQLERGEGLMIVPCRGVHMYLMTYPIDVALMDGGGTVVAMYRDLAPGTRTHWHRDAHQALEVPAGTLAETHTALGDLVEWKEPGPVEPPKPAQERPTMVHERPRPARERRRTA